MKPLTGSGAARIAHDTAKRYRGLAEVLRHDLTKINDSLSPLAYIEVRERIERYDQQADEIEKQVRKYIGAAP